MLDANGTERSVGRELAPAHIAVLGEMSVATTASRDGGWWTTVTSTIVAFALALWLL